MGNAANATISDAAPALWIAMGIFAVVFFVLAAVRIPEPFAIQDAKSEKKDKHSAMSFRHFVLGTVAIFIYVGVEVGIPNFMNLFLTSTPDAATPGIGMAAAAAGSLVGTYWFLMMCGRLIGGVIGGKVSSKAQLPAVSVVALVFVLLGIFAPIDTMGRMPVFTGTGFAMIEVPIGVMFLTLCGLCTSVMWGGIFNLAVEGLGKYTSMGSGIFMVMVCGGGILPLIQGYVADISNYLSRYSGTARPRRTRSSASRHLCGQKRRNAFRSVHHGGAELYRAFRKFQSKNRKFQSSALKYRQKSGKNKRPFKLGLKGLCLECHCKFVILAINWG